MNNNIDIANKTIKLEILCTPLHQPLFLYISPTGFLNVILRFHVTLLIFLIYEISIKGELNEICFPF